MNNHKEIFHVHTYRCKHATGQDSEYIEKAIDLGAKRITFTEHSPFPQNPFGNRMDMVQLPEYISTLSLLRKKYDRHIDIRIGLEIEYLPYYSDYYYQLSQIKGLDLLMIGQHFYQHPDGHYSFSDPMDYRVKNEAYGIVNAIIDAIKTGLFSVVAHPDRAFRYCKTWGYDQEELARRLIAFAQVNEIVLELNKRSSEKTINQIYQKEFWKLLNTTNPSFECNIIEGVDAHSLTDLIE